MIADTIDELHAMADEIGVARRWFQGDHYDICKAKRALAVRFGAVELDRRTLSAMAMLMRWSLPMGTPSTAIARLTEARKILYACGTAEKMREAKDKLRATWASA
jgi:hypothetical protein